MALASEKHRKHTIQDDEFENILKKLLIILNECCIIWNREDTLSLEGDMLKMAEMSRDKIKVILQKIKN